MPFAPPKHRPPGMLSKEEYRAKLDAARREEKNKIYDAAWRKCRVLFLVRHPRCDAVVPKTGLVCGAAATDVDHVLSPRTHPQLRLVWSNLRSRCHSCHSRRTALDQGFANPARRQYDF